MLLLSPGIIGTGPQAYLKLASLGGTVVFMLACFETGSSHVTLTGLELTVETRLTQNSQRSALLMLGLKVCNTPLFAILYI